mgnify:CR=1 FL=1
MARNTPFDDEGKMLYGWVASDNAERIDNTDGDAFKDGVTTSVVQTMVQ